MMTENVDLLKEARKLSEQGKTEEARMCLLKILKDDPGNVASLLALGGSYFESENYKEAKIVFKQLIKISPGKGLYSIALFNAFWRLDEKGLALEEIKRFVICADKEVEKETIIQYLTTLSAMENNKNIDENIST